MSGLTLLPKYAREEQNLMTTNNKLSEKIENETRCWRTLVKKKLRKIDQHKHAGCRESRTEVGKDGGWNIKLGRRRIV